MSICVARFRETVTPLMRSSPTSGEEMRFQVPPKTSDTMIGKHQLKTVD